MRLQDASSEESVECPIFDADAQAPLTKMSSLDCSWAWEDADLLHRPRPLELGSQVALAAIVTGVALFAAHAADAEHGLFYVLDTLAALLFLAIATLYCTGRLQPGGRWWPHGNAFLVSVLVWLLSLLLSFAAPSRRRRLLDLEDSALDEPCEEGVTALWIGLLLTLMAVRVQMPARFFASFGQFISLQYLLIGLVLPRPECNADRVPRGGPGGPLLGLAPIWTAAIQLHALALALVAVQWDRDADQHITALAATYVQNFEFRALQSTDSEVEDGVLRNGIERAVEELDMEAHFLKCLLSSVRREHLSSTHTAWASVVGTLGYMVSKHAKLLKSSSGGVNQADVCQSVKLSDAIAKGATSPDSATSGLGNGQTLSGWIVESWTEQVTFGSKAGKTSPPEPTKPGENPRPDERTSEAICMKGLAPGLGDHIGQWDFDALTVAKEQENIIEVVGFEFLRQFVFMSRDPLQGFLKAVESMYQKSNPYHTNVHAVDMTNSFLYIIQRSTFLAGCDLPDAIGAATILAGLGHDVGHPGRNNAFMVSTRNNLAITYNDRSVLENFHAASLIRLLDEKYGSDEPGERVQLLAALPSHVVTSMRSLMTTLILKTDTQKHLEDLAAFRLRLGADEFEPMSNPTDQQQVMCIMFRSADIGHSAKAWVMHEEWSKRVVREFHAQGDEEKRLGLKVSPLCEREGFVLATAQCGFLQFICLPTWRELARFEAMIHKKPQDDSDPWQLTKSEFVVRSGLMVKTPSQGFEKAAGSIDSGQRRNSAGAIPKNIKLDVQRPSKGYSSARLSKGNQSTKVMPMGIGSRPSVDSTASLESTRLALQRKRGPKKYIAETCLAQCDRNFLAWKTQAEAPTSSDADLTSRGSGGKD